MDGRRRMIFRVPEERKHARRRDHTVFTNKQAEL